MSAELKPLACPFCGHVGLDFAEGSTFRWIVGSCGGCGATRGETRIQTLGEGTKEEWMAVAQADAIAEWNRRATPAPGAPAGFKLVPIEPTEAMMNAAFQAHEDKPLTDWGKIVPANDDEIYRAMLDAAPGAPGQEAAAVQAVGAPEEMQLCLCEFAKIVPQPNRLYRPIYMPGCKACDHLAGEQIDAYGERSPTYEEIEAAALPPSGAGEKTC